jgi:hypothetical protein
VQPASTRRISTLRRCGWGAPPASGDRGDIVDVNGDGRADLVVSFPARDVTLSRPGDVVVDLEGRTWSGLPFSGTDLVDYVR